MRDISTRLPLPNIISEVSPYSYSDHEAVETCFTVEKTDEADDNLGNIQK